MSSHCLVRKVLARRRAQDDVGDRMRHLLTEIEATDLADLPTEFGRRHTVEVGGQKPRSLLAREVVEKAPRAVAAIDHPDHRDPRPEGPSPRRASRLRGSPSFAAHQLPSKLRKHLKGGLDQRAKLRSEAAGVHLPNGLIEEVAQPAQLADDGVVRSGNRRNLDPAIEGESPGEGVSWQSCVVRATPQEAELAAGEVQGKLAISPLAERQGRTARLTLLQTHKDPRSR